MELSFVGRQAQLEALRQLHARAAIANGSVVLINGVPGVGKSRLLREFAAELRDGTTISVAAHEGAESPLRVWRSVAAAIDRRLAGHNPAAGNNPAHPDTSGDGAAALVIAQADPTQDLADIADRLLGLLLTLPRPVTVIIEDLHWADAASVRLLSLLSQLISTEPILILASQRVAFGEQPGVEAPVHAQLITLSGLRPSDIATALANRYPGEQESLLMSAGEQLVRVTGGNPLAVFATVMGLERHSDDDAVIDQLVTASFDDVEAPMLLRNALDLLIADLAAGDVDPVSALALTDEPHPAILGDLIGYSPEDVVASLGRAAEVGVVARRARTFEIAHPLIAAALLDSLPNEKLAQMNAKYVAHLVATPDPDWALVLAHALQTEEAFSNDQIVEYADAAGQQAYDSVAFEDADRYLAIAQTRVSAAGNDTSVTVKRLMLRADANMRIGRLAEAYELYRAAADAAAAVGDSQTLARAAVGFAFPPDWRAGSPEALELLIRAEESLAATRAREGELDRGQQLAAVQLQALRAVLEMRIPQPSADGEQWAWVVRAEVSQPRAQAALAAARELADPRTTLIAALAWRWTHRGPSFLTRRTEVAREALDLALELNDSQQAIEACVRLIVDHLEAGDRRKADEVLAIAGWLSDRAQDLRITWRANGLKAGLAAIDSDWEQFDVFLRAAEEAGNAASIPGAFVLDHTLRTHRATLVGDFEFLAYNEEVIQLIPMHPLVSSCTAYALALAGRIPEAQKRVDVSFDLLDSESSWLQSLTYLGKATVLTGNVGHAQRLIDYLSPWMDRVAIDAEALMSADAIGLVVADLAAMLGRSRLETQAREVGLSVSERLHLVDRVRYHRFSQNTPGRLLTPRESAILHEIVRGRTNAEIAERLSYSLATVRRDTMSIYAKLNVRGRANAASRAVELGLVARQ